MNRLRFNDLRKILEVYTKQPTVNIDTRGTQGTSSLEAR